MEENTQGVTNEDLLNALNKLYESSDSTNKSVQELQAYFIAKDKKEKQEAETLKKQQEQEAQEQAELEEQQQRETESVEAEQSAKADAETETYTELLTDIRDQIQLNNQLISGQFLMFGIICGILLFKILWDKLT
jgi:F0F1-type ATP synthase assembly protein I